MAWDLAVLCRPFLLQAKASYTAIGIFSLASYPYSLKLLWSPIVDSIYSLAFGRRKSWVVRTASLPLCQYLCTAWLLFKPILLDRCSGTAFEAV